MITFAIMKLLWTQEIQVSIRINKFEIRDTGY